MAENVDDSEWPTLNDVAGHNSKSKSTSAHNKGNKKCSKKKKINWNPIEIETPSYRENRNSEYRRSTNAGNPPHNENRNGYYRNSENRRGNRTRNTRRGGRYNNRNYCYENSYQLIPVAETLTVNNDELYCFNNVVLSESGLILEMQTHLEWLLSDRNLASDLFFQSRMDNHGLIPIGAFLGCKKMITLHATLPRLVRAAQQSNKIELVGRFVRRIVDPLHWKSPVDGLHYLDEENYYVIQDGLWTVYTRDPNVSTDNVESFQQEGATYSPIGETVSCIVNPQFDENIPLQNGFELQPNNADYPPLYSMADSQLDEAVLLQNGFELQSNGVECPSLHSLADSQLDNAAVLQNDSALQSNDADCPLQSSADSESDEVVLQNDSELQSNDADCLQNGMADSQLDEAVLLQNESELQSNGTRGPENGMGDSQLDETVLLQNESELQSNGTSGPENGIGDSQLDEAVLVQNKSELQSNGTSCPENGMADSQLDKTVLLQNESELQSNGSDSMVFISVANKQHKTPSANGVADSRFKNGDISDISFQVEGNVVPTLVENISNLQLQDAENSDNETGASVNSEVELVLADDSPTVLLENFSYSTVEEDATCFTVSQEIPGTSKSKLIKVSSVSDCVYFNHQGQTNILNIVPVNGYNTEVPYGSDSTSVYYPAEELYTAVNSSNCVVHLSPEPLRLIERHCNFRLQALKLAFYATCNPVTGSL